MSWTAFKNKVVDTARNVKEDWDESKHLKEIQELKNQSYSCDVLANPEMRLKIEEKEKEYEERIKQKKLANDIKHEKEFKNKIIADANKKLGLPTPPAGYYGGKKSKRTGGKGSKKKGGKGSKKGSKKKGSKKGSKKKK